RGIDGLVGEGADQGPDAARAGDQGGGRCGQVGPARADQCLDAAALGDPPMRFVRRFGPVALTACLLFTCSDAFAASAEKGKAAYTQHGCWQCHGTPGQGAVTGPKPAPDPLPIDTFTAYVR